LLVISKLEMSWLIGEIKNGIKVPSAKLVVGMAVALFWG
jgi:hypothetical protein